MKKKNDRKCDVVLTSVTNLQFRGRSFL